MSERAVVLEVPDLRCELIRLRPWQPADAPDLEKAWTDPAILSDSVAPEDRSLQDARKWISRTDVRRRAGVALDLVVADATSDLLLGEVSLYRFDKSRRASLISWWLSAPARGQGIATRAVNLLATWALDGPLTAVIAEIKMSNAKSLELATRCGFDLLRPARESKPAVYVRRAPGPSGPPVARAARPWPERPGERSEQEREVERSEQEREVEQSEQERESGVAGKSTGGFRGVAKRA